MDKILKYTSKDFNHDSPSWTDGDTETNSEFDNRLRCKWDEAMNNGVFRYTLDHVQTRVLDGLKHYVAQLNVKRATDRRTPQNITSVNQPFDPNLFNFTKIKEPEILMYLKRSDEENGIKEERNLVIINISPIEYGHVLIVPDVNKCQPQVLTESGIQLGMETVLLSARRSFRLGFNSLCAYASVNHLHFHAYYLEKELLVEYGPVEHICDILYLTNIMPVPGFAFQLHGSSITRLKRVIFKITEYFRINEIAHSLMMVKGTVFGEDRSSNNTTLRVYVWPRSKFKGATYIDAFNSAYAELGGHFPIKDEDSYRDITEESADIILAKAKLPDEEFQKIKTDVTQMVSIVAKEKTAS